MAIDEKDVVQGIWAWSRHKNEMVIAREKLEQERQKMNVFIQSQNQEAQIYDKQLKLLERQTEIQARQTTILKRTLWIYAFLALIAALNLILAYLTWKRG